MIYLVEGGPFALEAWRSPNLYRKLRSREKYGSPKYHFGYLVQHSSRRNAGIHQEAYRHSDQNRAFGKMTRVADRFGTDRPPTPLACLRSRSKADSRKARFGNMMPTERQYTEQDKTVSQ